MDVYAKLDELVTLVEGARSMPMSSSCIVNRTEVLGLVEDLRALLPDEIEQSRQVLAERAEILEEARQEARQIVDQAYADRNMIVSETEIYHEAMLQADQIRVAAVEETNALRREVDDYVDGKLATFEIVLDKTLAAVKRGRDKLQGRQDLEADDEHERLGDALADD